MLDAARDKGIVNRIVGELIRRGEVKANQVEWTDDSGEVFTNPSTPVITLYDGDREMTAICITWRRLERMKNCFLISAGKRPVPTHRA